MSKMYLDKVRWMLREKRKGRPGREIAAAMGVSGSGSIVMGNLIRTGLCNAYHGELASMTL